jgi:hypothetical protein
VKVQERLIGVYKKYLVKIISIPIEHVFNTSFSLSVCPVRSLLRQGEVDVI